MSRGRHEIANELFSEISEEFSAGDKIIDFIIRRVGGLRVSFPDIEDREREERNKKINMLHNGRNIEELGIRFNLSSKQIRNIIYKKKRKEN